MRNLKRVLSLALALVMVLGMMVMTTSAATFTDAEEITYQEAVDVMSAIGVIDGVEAADGTFTFNPTDKLTREQGAKIVCYLLMGKTAAEKLTGSGKFTDVAATRWSAGAIDYCATLGILDGVGNGKFNPTGPLKAVEFGKMLLCALGYDAAIEGYTGSNWATSIATDMIDTGLDVYGVAMDAQLTREQAAQMALQALTMTLVKYDNPGTEIVLSDGTKVIVGASPASAKTWANFPGATPVNYTGAVPATAQSVEFCERYFSNLAQSSDTVNGRDGYYWTVKTEKVSDFIISDVVLKTVYGDGTTLAEMTTKGGAYYIGLELDADVFGTPAAVSYYKNGSSVGASATDIQTAGVVAELIDTDYDGLVNKVCVVEKTVTTLTANPSISTVKEKDYVTIPACGVASKSVDDVIGYEDLKKGDVVLYVHMDDGSVVIEKAESFNGFVLGSMTSYGTTYDLIGEEYYTDTGLSVTGLNDYNEGTILDPTVEYTFYLDNAGFIVKAVPVSTAVVSNYAVVRDIVWVKPVTDGSIGASAKSYAQAKLVFADGTYEVVTIASIDGFKFADATKTLSELKGQNSYRTYVKNAAADVTNAVLVDIALNSDPALGDGKYIGYAKTSTGALTAKYLGVDDTSAATGTATLETAIPENTFYTYTVNTDGSYNLSTSAKLGETVAALSADTIDNGKVQFNGTNVADANTVFVYVTKDAKNQDVYTVYTGINNVPTTSTNVTGNFVKKTGTGVATLVFAEVNGTQDDSRDIVYITSTSYTTINGKTPYYVYNAIVNGVVTTVKADASGLGVDFYKVDKVVDGVYTLNSTIANTADKVGVQSISGGILVTGTEDAYAYTTGATAYIIEKVGTKVVCTATTIDALTIDATDALFIQTKTVGGNTVAETVYVIKANENVTALTIAAGATPATAATVTQGDFFHATLDVAVTGLGKNIVISSITAKTDTTIKGVSINGVDAGLPAAWTECALKATAGVNTIVITVEDDFSGALSAYTYTFTVNS